jgi:hypothetical protein
MKTLVMIQHLPCQTVGGFFARGKRYGTAPLAIELFIGTMPVSGGLICCF